LDTPENDRPKNSAFYGEGGKLRSVGGLVVFFRGVFCFCEEQKQQLLWVLLAFAYQRQVKYIVCVWIHYRVYSSLRDFGPLDNNNNNSRSIYFYMRILER